MPSHSVARTSSLGRDRLTFATFCALAQGADRPWPGPALGFPRAGSDPTARNRSGAQGVGESGGAREERAVASGEHGDRAAEPPARCPP
jgi:hypothetical protein